jgi:hypothetical protein
MRMQARRMLESLPSARESRIRLVLLILLLLTLWLPARDAHAYLDPGTGSFLLQAVIAVVMGALLSLKLYWQQLKSFFAGKRDRPGTERDDG